MDNFFGIGTSDSFYDKRRHINMIFIEFLSYHIFSDSSYSDRIVSLLKSSKSEEDRAFCICNNFLTYNELNFLKLLRERYNLSEAEFITILSGIGAKDKITKSPAGYDANQNKVLLVHMVIAIESMTSNFGSKAVTEITRMIGTVGKGMRGIFFDQTKFNKLFDLTFEAMRVYGDSDYLPQIEQYVLERW